MHDPVPTPAQCRTARAVTSWYLRLYYGSPEDVGVASMFCRPDRVGHFAVDPGALSSGDGDALFRLLVTMTMFQRRSDLQIMRVLQGIREGDARELTDAARLLRLADSTDCPHASDLRALTKDCDLVKDPSTRRGSCRSRPDTACHLKRHTELLKRYGHFGKVPTSAALALRANGAATLPRLKERIWARVDCPRGRALALQDAISRSWRVSDKISAMFLSAVTNRDLSGDLAPWADGVDTSHFVVIDSNVDLFLKAIGYQGARTYRKRREFLQALSKGVRLDEDGSGMQPYNPRIVQQALYMFMSESNRRASERDCSHEAPQGCSRCPTTLSRVCPRRDGRPVAGRASSA